MNLFARFEKLSDVIAAMNQEAVNSRDIPYIRLHDYVQYCDVCQFFYAYTRTLRLPKETSDELLAFCYRDTLYLKPKIGKTDFYQFTFAYFKGMTYRTGNLDTPDDCVEKLDLERFLEYKALREKEWAHETLSIKEQELLSSTVRKAMEWEMGNLPGMKATR